METAPIGKVSKLKSLFLNVTNTVFNYTYHVKTDFQGAVSYSYNFSDDLVQDNSSFEQFLTLNLLPGKVSLKTEFGVRVEQGGSRGEVFVPYVYSGLLEGICGNYDFNKTNDFKCSNGTVFPFDAGNTFEMTKSEYETAKCWKLNGDDGPKPGEIGKSCPEAKICEKLFENEVFSKCVEKIDTSEFIEACKIDYCQEKSTQTLTDIQSIFMHKCSDILPRDPTTCNWRNEIGLNECPINSIWSGCKVKPIFEFRNIIENFNLKLMRPF